MRQLFNSAYCTSYGCYVEAAVTVKKPKFAQVWSRYAGEFEIENFAGLGDVMDYWRRADVVLAFSAAAGRSGPHEVRCVKNLTWSRTVGQLFILPNPEWNKINSYYHSAPDFIKKDWNLDAIASLRRKP